MSEKRKDELMRPISVSVSPAMVAQLQSRALEQTPENPNVSAYVRKLIFQDLEGLVLDRTRALWVYKQLERVEGFLDNLRLFDAIPQRVIDQAGEYCRLVHELREAVWRLSGPEPQPPAAALSSTPPSDARAAASALASVDLDRLARSVPSRAVAGPSARKHTPSSGTAPRSKARTSPPSRARG